MDDMLDSVFKSYIGRIVAFVLAPVLLVAVPPVTNAINEVLGTGYSDQQISNVAIATVVGLAIVIWQWLRNRGNWEKQLAELKALYEAGEQAIRAVDAAGPVDVKVEVEQGAVNEMAGQEQPSSSALGTQKK